MTPTKYGYKRKEAVCLKEYVLFFKSDSKYYRQYDVVKDRNMQAAKMQALSKYGNMNVGSVMPFDEHKKRFVEHNRFQRITGGTQ